MSSLMIETPAVALQRLLAALLIGLVIGLDRERAEKRQAQPQFAGVRTFPLIALAGALPMLLPALSPWLAIAAFLAVAAVCIVSYLRSSAAGDMGATTEVAALATFVLGSLAGAGQLLVAGAAGIAVAVLLAAKPRLERFSRALTPQELSSALVLAVITVIVLPLLPDRGYGPWGALNPRDIWLVVVLVCALSFAGFIAMRLLGQGRGLLATGLAGGMVSSTAVTLAMAQRSRAAPTLARPAAAAAILASCVMSIRIIFFGATMGAGILPRLAPALLIMATAGVGVALVLRRTPEPRAAAQKAQMPNPFSLRSALLFAAIYAAVLLGVRASQEYLGTRGTFLMAAVSAIADVDAVTIALVRQGPLEDGWRQPAAAATLAAVVNNLFKAGMAAVGGEARFRKLTAGALILMSALGAGAGLFIYLRG